MIVEALGEMPSLNSDSSVRENSDIGVSENVRRTRTAFLAGGRGTGKTTVMTSLMRDSRPERFGREPRPISDSREGADEVSHKGPTDEAKELARKQRHLRDKLLYEMRSRVVWLETLDMEPLPKSANLIAAILMRLEDAAKLYGANLSPNSPRGLLEPSSEYHAALLELQLDQDAYAVEVMRTEKARLSINSKFTKTLNQLARYVFRSVDIQDPLFILSVDDFDLNPAICLELLRVLRMISAPRLFTIVLGDLRVVSTVLALKLSNDLGSIADSGLKENMLALDPATVGALAGDVAANALRKLLPPGQRVELSPMQLTEALNFKPLGVGEGQPRLHELLGSCPVFVDFDLAEVSGTVPTELERRSVGPEAEPRLASLRQLLLAPGIQAEASEEEHKEKAADSPEKPDKLDSAVANTVVYSGASFVKAPPRHVADTWLELYKITGYGEPRAEAPADEDVAGLLVSHFAKVSQAALRETPDFNPDERAKVERAIGRTISDNWTLRALPITVLAETTRSAAVELPFLFSTRTKQEQTSGKSRAATSPPPRVSIVTAEDLGWQMRISQMERRGT